MNAPHIQHAIELKQKTTLRLGGTVPFFVSIRHEHELNYLPEIIETCGSEFRILGGGSNLLIADSSTLPQGQKTLEFWVIHINIQNENMPIFETVSSNIEKGNLPPLAQKALEENKKIIRTKIPAGMSIPKLLQLCEKNSCEGLEGLIGIPSSVGGAIAMNAGAYGTEIGDVLESITIFNPKTGFKTLTRKDFSTAYRHFSINTNIEHDEKYIICHGNFVFPHQDSEIIKTTMRKNLDAKKSSQPMKAFTAGCVFKNPNSIHLLSVGEMLDKLGFKGKAKGDMQFSPIHANFLENKGHGTTHDALELLECASNLIYSEFGIHLEKEVKIW